MNVILAAFDPGLEFPGVAVVKFESSRATALLVKAWDFRQLRELTSTSERVFTIVKAMLETVEQYPVDVYAVERSGSTLKGRFSTEGLSRVRQALYDLHPMDKKFLEVDPQISKKAITGNGHATKDQVKDMAMRMFDFPLSKLKKLAEAQADSLAIALGAHGLLERERLGFSKGYQ